MRAMLVATTVVLVLAVLAGAGAWYFMLAPDGGPGEAATEEADGDGKGKADKNPIKPIKMKPLQVPVIQGQQIVARLNIIVRLKVPDSDRIATKNALPAVRQAMVERLYTLLPAMMEDGGDVPDKSMIHYHLRRAARRTLRGVDLKKVIIKRIQTR